jgi:hypothetical protein
MMKFRGIPEITKKIQQVAKEFRPKVEAAGVMEMEIEATEMKRRTPVDTTPNAPHPGNLRDSIHVEPPEWHGDQLEIIVATGAQAPYDIHVHENPDAIHPIGQWKFMESVLNESRRSMLGRLARRLSLG